jgi:hypothetical protein
VNREIVRLWVRSKDDEQTQKAVKILSAKCEVVVLESPGAKEPGLATAFGVFRGMEQIEYFATAWIQ